MATGEITHDGGFGDLGVLALALPPEERIGISSMAPSSL